MPANVLVPGDGRLRTVRAIRRPGPPSLELRGLDPVRARSTADRVRAAVRNAGFTIPSGRIAAGPDGPVPGPGIDLPLALAILLADSAHRRLRRPNLIAWGALGLDGTLAHSPAPAVGDLPEGAWVGRFWRPTEHVPDPDEDAVLMLVDVETLPDAWDVLARSIEMEAELGAAHGRRPVRPG